MDPYYLIVGLTAAMFLLYGAVSRKLDEGVVTAPMVCVAAGYGASLLGPSTVPLALDGRVLTAAGELALAILLFTDASGIDRAALRRDWVLPVRLLGLGLPLTVVAGALLGAALFPELPWPWLGALALILAPTDAALGIAVLRNVAVPQRVRDALNVESGLNDGIALPPLLALLAALAAHTAGSDEWLLDAAAELAVGALLGTLVGRLAGPLLDAAWRRRWIDETYARLLTPGLALLAFVVAHAMDKNGFVAAYFAGLTLAVSTPELRERLSEFGEADGTQFSLFVFLLFGFAFVPAAAPHWDVAAVVYALGSLTLVRMLPVWLCLAGSGLPPATKLFMGWSGPRGIASVLYVAIVVQQFGLAGHERVFAVVVLTVLASVLLHGVTAAPLSALYARRDSGPRQPAG